MSDVPSAPLPLGAPEEEHKAPPDAFEAAIGVLTDHKTLQDPDQVRRLLEDAPAQVATPAMDRLWRFSAAQSALAEVLAIAGDREATVWQTGWKISEAALREALITSIGIDGKVLADYVKAVRAAAAIPQVSPSLRSLEGALKRQRELIGFHWDEENNRYRRREAELSQRTSAAHTTEDARHAAAKDILEEISRYRGIYLPKLQAATTEVTRVWGQCQALVALFPDEEAYAQIRRWNELTLALVDSRRAAVEHIDVVLDWDALIPNDILSGGLVIRAVDGNSTPTLSEEASLRVSAYAEKIALLIEQSIKTEERTQTERDALTRQIIGDLDPNPVQATADVSGTPAQTMNRRSHPIERTPWYRLARIVWWGALALWCLLSLVVFSGAGIVTAVLVGVVLLYAIKAGVFYVALGRTTVWERDGSGFVDLDVVEEETFEQAGSGSAETAQAFKDLRSRYGRRVPTEVARAWSAQQLADAQAKKRGAIALADKQGATISIDSLRTRFISGQPTGMDANEYRSVWEPALLRLEVEHGPDVPISAASTLADSLDARPNAR